MSNKDCILGSAAWGWNVDRTTAFALLDTWLASGRREIDAATNYPINLQPADFRASERILTDYIKAHGLDGELAITMKIGSLNNLRTPEINLSPSFILMMAGEYQRLWGNNLTGIMLHWDNRDDAAAIAASLDALLILQQQRIQPGLSGIKYPAVYAAAAADYPDLRFDLELKHHVFYSDLHRYAPLHVHTRRRLAYGINAGGVKLNGQYHEDSSLHQRGGEHDAFAEAITRIETYLPKWNAVPNRPPVTTMNHLGLIHALQYTGIDGVLLGTSSVAQLKETLAFVDQIQVFDYQDVLLDLSA
jgi:aryl-alcohol dehydrogenase-like predicted oxidoreductase